MGAFATRALSGCAGSALGASNGPPPVYDIDVPYVPRGEWSRSQANVRTDKEAWQSIQDQIDAVPDGQPGRPNIIRFPVGYSTGLYYTHREDGTSTVKGCIELIDRHHLILEGPSKEDPAAFYTSHPSWPYPGEIQANQFSNRKQFLIRNSTHIEIRNIRVFGSNYTFADQLADGNPWFWGGGADLGGTSATRAYYAPWEFEHALDFRDSSSLHVHDCVFEDLWGDGVYFGNDPGCSDVLVENVVIDGTGRQGIAISGGQNLLIDGVAIGTSVKSRRAGIDLEPEGDWVIDGVEIRNCRIDSQHVPFACGGRGSRLDNVEIHTNELFGTSVPWVKVVHSAGLSNRSNWSIHDNIHRGGLGSPVYALSFERVDNVSVVRNVMNVAGTQSRGCVDFKDCTGLLDVIDNDFGGGCFIRFRNSPVGTISGNSCATDCGCNVVLE
jgi:hypothetical protein